MVTILTTGDLELPAEILDPWLDKIRYGSAVGVLSPATPMKFGMGEAWTFDIGEAEYVGEGASKGPSSIFKSTIGTRPFKFHKTVRWTEEIQWADEDTQLNALREILDQIQPALSRALDYGVFHGTNPATGELVPEMVAYLEQTPNQVTPVDGEAPYVALDAADALVLGAGYAPSDVALAPLYASTFSGARTEQGVKLYADLTLATQPASMLDGHRSSVSDTVSSAGRTVNADGTAYAPVAANSLAFVGDFSAIRWGIQKQIGLTLIPYGDPDSQGDLKRNNQVAFRAEVVYGWGIAALEAFAEIATP